MSQKPFLRIDNIRKRFGPIVASDGVSLEIEEGEIHSLLGENGAGKSVLMSMICGMVRPDEGEIVGSAHGRSPAVRSEGLRTAMLCETGVWCTARRVLFEAILNRRDAERGVQEGCGFAARGQEVGAA